MEIISQSEVYEEDRHNKIYDHESHQLGSDLDLSRTPHESITVSHGSESRVPGQKTTEQHKSQSLASSSSGSHKQKLEGLKSKMSVVGSMTRKHEKVIYRAFAVAIIDQEHIPLALNQISMKDDKFIQAKNVVMAFRINSPEEVLVRSKDGNDIVEGFDNGDLEGCGEKLLHLLQRISVENILIIIAISYFGLKGSLQIGSYSHCINIARDLLTSLHNKALDFEQKSEAEGEDDEVLDVEDELQGVGNKIHLVAGGEPYRISPFKATSNRHSILQNQRKRIRTSHNRIKVSSNYPLQDLYSPQSVTDNENSVASIPKRATMSPYFGQQQDIDQSQVIPRVFNFPEFMNKNHRYTKRPNTYFAELAAANSKFSNTSRRQRRRKNGKNSTGIHLEAHGKMMQYNMNGDLNLHQPGAFSSDARQRSSYGQSFRMTQANYTGINHQRRLASYSMNRNKLNKTTNIINPHLPRISDQSPFSPLKSSTNEIITEEVKSPAEKKIIKDVKRRYKKKEETLKRKSIEAHRLAKIQRKSDLEGLEISKDQPKLKVVKKPVFTCIPKRKAEPKPGNFLQPKRLILTDYKVLVPSAKAAPTVSVFNIHDNLPNSDSREHLDEVEIPDIDLTNYDNASLGFVLNAEVEKPKFRIQDVKRMMDEVPNDIHKLEDYIDHVELDDKPTNVLVKLAEQCKKRRRKLYKDLKNPDSSSESSNESQEDEMIANFKSYRIQNKY
ncbi:unnamed protein product [Moneuplotes crassus]|uniref:Impact N-terminal domain-containing protein n=1 Tax=Euplotes crassus TaxID=5936 RepID=A0AAD1Y5D1_EUPCR|nr:unnamed protein product [Moneuplotes crassus]